MSAFRVIFTDGTYVEYPQGGEQAAAVVDWFRNASDDQVISMSSSNGETTHAQKRNISRVVVFP